MTVSRRFFFRKLISLTKGLAVLGIPHTLYAKSIQPRIFNPLLGTVSIFAFNNAPRWLDAMRWTVTLHYPKFSTVFALGHQVRQYK
jgi:hypothetical protein